MAFVASGGSPANNFHFEQDKIDKFIHSYPEETNIRLANKYGLSQGQIFRWGRALGLSKIKLVKKGTIETSPEQKEKNRKRSKARYDNKVANPFRKRVSNSQEAPPAWWVRENNKLN